MKQATNNELVKFLSELFIGYRKSHIEQQSDGTYHFIDKCSLHDNYHITQHILGNKTVGVFSGADVGSKYICFDVDTKARSILDTRALIYTLVSEFNIHYDYIQVAYSGNKGYHVYLLFDEMVSMNYLKTFYREVITSAGFTTSEVELRPTVTQGVKLPLGVHRLTGNRCYFVDTRTKNFEPLPMNHIKQLKQLNAKTFITNNNLKELHEINKEQLELELAKFLSQREVKTFVHLTDLLDLTEYQVIHVYEDIEGMLENKLLKYPDTRNKYTLLIGIYLRDKGYNEDETRNIINEIMLNSKKYKGLVNSSETHIKRETKRIVKYTFKENYTLSVGSNKIILYKDEIKDILEIGNVKLMMLYLSMIIHAKRHQPIGADNFYMAYSVMTNYGNARQRSTLRKNINELEHLGRIEVIQSGVKDHVRSEAEGRGISKTNVYKIKKNFNQNTDENVLIKANTETIDLYSILAKALDENAISITEIKNSFSKYEFKKFKQSL